MRRGGILIRASTLDGTIIVPMTFESIHRRRERALVCGLMNGLTPCGGLSQSPRRPCHCGVPSSDCRANGWYSRSILMLLRRLALVSADIAQYAANGVDRRQRPASRRETSRIAKRTAAHALTMAALNSLEKEAELPRSFQANPRRHQRVNYGPRYISRLSTELRSIFTTRHLKL